MATIRNLLLYKLLDTDYKFRHEYGFLLFGNRCNHGNFRWYFPCIVFL